MRKGFVCVPRVAIELKNISEVKSYIEIEY